MRIKCPSCHADFDLVAALESEAGRELVRLLAEHSSLARPLVTYLSLFRSASRALAWDRALRLAQEVIAMESDPQRLAVGLSKAVESLRAKQGEGWKPMSNHNYLRQVLKGLPCTDAKPSMATVTAPPAYTSKSALSLLALEELNHG